MSHRNSFIRGGENIFVIRGADIFVIRGANISDLTNKQSIKCSRANSKEIESRGKKVYHDSEIVQRSLWWETQRYPIMVRELWSSLISNRLCHKKTERTAYKDPMGYWHRAMEA